jgi:hypothetical protein
MSCHYFRVKEQGTNVVQVNCMPEEVKVNQTIMGDFGKTKILAVAVRVHTVIPQMDRGRFEMRVDLLPNLF